MKYILIIIYYDAEKAQNIEEIIKCINFNEVIEKLIEEWGSIMYYEIYKITNNERIA